MASTTQRYPLSSPDGTPIPLEVIRPLGVMVKSFDVTVSGSITLPPTVEILSILASANCIITFGANASVPADGVVLDDSIYVVSGMRVTVAPIADTFTIIGDGESGSVVIQMIDKWVGLALQTQYDRR